MARKPKNQAPPTDLDTKSGGLMTLTDDDIGLGAVNDGTELPDEEEEDLEEEHGVPQGSFSQENTQLDSESAPVDMLPVHTSDQTEFPEEYEATSGRPHKEISDRGITDRMGIPSATYKYYKSDATNPRQKTKKCFEWWNRLPTWAKDRILIYVYRDWPILTQADDEDYAYIDKISGNEPMQDENDVLNRYGCGSYRMVFNDTNLKGNNRTIVTLWLTGLGGADLKSNPPGDRRISDVKQVERDHPANRSYIGFLQMRGLLPEQNHKKDDDDMPAVVEVIREANAQNERMMNKVLEAHAGKENEKDVMKEAMASAVGVLTDANRIGMETLTKAHEQARDIATAAATGNGTAKDPMEMALQIVNLIRGGNSGDSSVEVLELRRQIEEMRSQQIKDLQVQLLELMKAKTNETSDGGLSSLKSNLETMKALRELMDDMGGGGKADAADAVAEAAGDMAPKWLRPYVPIFSTVAQAVMPAILNWMQPGAGAPGAAPTPQYAPGPGVPVPGAPPVVNPSHPQLSGPQPAPGPGVGPQPVPSPAQQQNAQLQIILQGITYPLLTHMTNPALSGGDFAEWFSDGYGVETFKQLAGFGEAAVASALLGHPPITQLMQQHNVDQVRFRSFVKDFCETEFTEDGAEGEQHRHRGVLALAPAQLLFRLVVDRQRPKLILVG